VAGRAVPAPGATFDRVSTTRATSQGPQTEHALTPQQLAFFETFGFLRLPGLFAPEIDQISEAFDEVFASDAVRVETNAVIHFKQPRVIIPQFVDLSDGLRWIRHDPRLLGVVTSILGETYDYRESDGNIFSCDTGWHSDIYESPLDQYHIKLYFYLDPVTADSGALRVIPGTNHWQTDYAQTLRRQLHDPDELRDLYGITPQEVPGWVIETEPGDMIVGSFRTLHASFGGSDRRRAFTINYRETLGET
jgi:hypothetical protein